MDDEFYLDDSDFDNELSLLDQEKLKVIEQIKTYVGLVEENVRFQENSDYETNFRVLARYISAMVDLNNLADEKGLTEDELITKIKGIENTVCEMSYENLHSDQYASIEEEAQVAHERIKSELDDSENEESNDDDNSLDW